MPVGSPAARRPPSPRRVASRRPRCGRPGCSTIERAMLSPRPLPPVARPREASLRWKRSKTSSRSSGRMPGPSSSTATTRDPPSALPERTTRPSAPAWRRALPSRLRTTWAVRSGSMRILPSGMLPGLDVRGEPPQVGAGLHLLRRRADASLVEAGEAQQVVDEPFGATYLDHRHPLDVAYLLGARRLVAGQHLELPANRGQRASQLVRRVRYEHPLPGEGAVEAVEHVVERLRERPQLRRHRGVRREPGREVSGVDLGCRGRKPTQRSRGAGRDQIAAQQGGDQGHPADQQEGLLHVGMGISDRGQPRRLPGLGVARQGLLASLLPADDGGLVATSASARRRRRGRRRR